MWVIIGHRTKTERVPDGLAVDRRCGSCGEETTFYERRAVRTFRVYFVDVFDYSSQRVMACGACGALFATDEHGRPSEETAEGWKHALSSAADSVGSAVSKAGDALGPMLERASENARDVFEEASPLAKRAGASISDALRRLRRELGDTGDDDDDEDLPESAREEDPEKAAVLKRFEELEARMKEKEKGE